MPLTLVITLQCARSAIFFKSRVVTLLKCVEILCFYDCIHLESMQTFSILPADFLRRCQLPPSGSKLFPCELKLPPCRTHFRISTSVFLKLLKNCLKTKFQIKLLKKMLKIFSPLRGENCLKVFSNSAMNKFQIKLLKKMLQKFAASRRKLLNKIA